MDTARTELADKLKNANNILVTVSRDPSVDQLSACIGLTLILNKLGKHTAAVFSGQIPSTIEFLKPSDTLEKNTDSLRDFIIALDKTKADKLRYKVEDNVVRIFITPYRTSISQADLEFSQGDFNVDVVVALGVQRQEDLDAAITAHGRILHDATLTSINTSTAGGLGSINWTDDQASSLGELVTELAQTLGDNLIDGQIATALLTGIVAETNRFSNNKTSSQTMSASAILMTAGANQQLVATKLEESGSVTAGTMGNKSDDQPPLSLSSGNSSGADISTLDINHDVNGRNSPAVPSLADQIPGLQLPSPSVADQAPETADNPEDNLSESSKLITDVPVTGGVLTANTQPEGLDSSTDPLSNSPFPKRQLLDHTTALSKSATDQHSDLNQSSSQPMFNSYTPHSSSFTPPPPSWMPPASNKPKPSNPIVDSKDGQTLTDLEASVHSPHLVSPANLDNAREEVSRALTGSQTTPEPIQALNAQQLGDVLHPSASTKSTPPITALPEVPSVDDPTAPPPVPPPIPFQFKPPGA